MFDYISINPFQLYIKYSLGIWLIEMALCLHKLSACLAKLERLKRRL